MASSTSQPLCANKDPPQPQDKANHAKSEISNASNPGCVWFTNGELAFQSIQGNNGRPASNRTRCLKSPQSPDLVDWHDFSHTKLLVVLINKLVLYAGQLAKYLAIFLNRSRSSSVRRSWERNFKISLLASTLLLDLCGLYRVDPLVKTVV